MCIGNQIFVYKNNNSTRIMIYTKNMNKRLFAACENAEHEAAGKTFI